MRLSAKALQLLAILASDVRAEYSGAELNRALSIASGTLYPLLARLEKHGLVASKWEQVDPRVVGRPRRRYYRITGAGAKVAQQETSVFALSPVKGVTT